MKILVTGAARAIGAATCRELKAAGHEVIATARDVSLLQELDVDQRLRLDITNEHSMKEALEEAGEIDAIVNNAALQGRAPLETYPVDFIRDMFETNTIGPLRLIQMVTPSWRTRGSGVIINVSSVQGRVASPLEGAYSATKYALEALSETLHYELSHFGIRVVIIEPGYIAPGMKRSMELPQPTEYQLLYEQWAGTDTKVTGESGRPGPEIVGRAIANALIDPSTPLRVPVGADAELILGVRSQLSDAHFETTMRSTLGLTW
jgi:NAD(P)-dependent dehydrogenase (short-subunit alcohol dehydrogenase family)